MVFNSLYCQETFGDIAKINIRDFGVLFPKSSCSKVYLSGKKFICIYRLLVIFPWNSVHIYVIYTYFFIDILNS